MKLHSTESMTIPWGLRTINHLGRALGRLGLGVADLDPDRLIAEARQSARLEDFGSDDSWEEGMRTQLRSFDQEGELSFVGKHALRIEVLRILTQRLRLQDDLRRHPEILDVPIERPIFILGFPRTGTTVLHKLFDQEPALRAPKMWELLRPSPPPDPATLDQDPRAALVQENVERVHKTVPALLSIHPLDAYSADECFYAFGLAFRNRTADAQAPCPSYMRWVMDQDLRPAYRYYKRVLQVLSWKSGPKRWVLKAPTHLFHIGALMEVFPDATILQTHRDPREVAASCCSLYEVTRQLFTDRQDPAAIGRSWLDTWGVAMERALAAREAEERLRPERFLDQRFEDFLTDPAAAALGQLQAFGQRPAPGTEARMRAWLEENRRDRHGRHRYTLAQYGLDPDEIVERFENYMRRFELI